MRDIPREEDEQELDWLVLSLQAHSDPGGFLVELR